MLGQNTRQTLKKTCWKLQKTSDSVKTQNTQAGLQCSSVDQIIFMCWNKPVKVWTQVCAGLGFVAVLCLMAGLELFTKKIGKNIILMFRAGRDKPQKTYCYFLFYFLAKVGLENIGPGRLNKCADIYLWF